MDARNENQVGHAAGATAATSARVECPACGTKGKAVKPVTIESLVVEEARRRIGRTDGFRFCAEPSCDVAYFHPESRARISKGEVRVRIGQKATEAPHPVCYCFGHTVEEIEAEVAATGTSRVPDQITEKCRQGLDRCEQTNPQGSCCLGNVRRAMQGARSRSAAGEPAAIAAPSATVETESCCATSAGDVRADRARRARSAGLWATGGAVVSAVLSSACCWLPLLLIAFGASAAGVAGFFEAYRPVLLGATGLLVAGGFFLAYVRKEKCGPGGACAASDTRLRRLNKIMLWVATAVVLAFALFPGYVGYLLGDGDPQAVASAPVPGESRAYRIDGMTCEACATALRGRLGAVPGVVRVDVSFGEGTARVFFAEGQPRPSDEALRAAIREAGYSGTPVEGDRTIRIAVSGMTCAGCAGGLRARLRGLPGVEAADVDYDSATATVRLAPGRGADAVLEAIAAHGFRGKLEGESGGGSR